MRPNPDPRMIAALTQWEESRQAPSQPPQDQPAQDQIDPKLKAKAQEIYNSVKTQIDQFAAAHIKAAGADSKTRSVLIFAVDRDISDSITTANRANVLVDIYASHAAGKARNTSLALGIMQSELDAYQANVRGKIPSDVMPSMDILLSYAGQSLKPDQIKAVRGNAPDTSKIDLEKLLGKDGERTVAILTKAQAQYVLNQSKDLPKNQKIQVVEVVGSLEARVEALCNNIAACQDAKEMNRLYRAVSEQLGNKVKKDVNKETVLGMHSILAGKAHEIYKNSHDKFADLKADIERKGIEIPNEIFDKTGGNILTVANGVPISAIDPFIEGKRDSLRINDLPLPKVVELAKAPMGAGVVHPDIPVLKVIAEAPAKLDAIEKLLPAEGPIELRMLAMNLKAAKDQTDKPQAMSDSLREARGYLREWERNQALSDDERTKAATVQTQLDGLQTLLYKTLYPYEVAPGPGEEFPAKEMLDARKGKYVVVNGNMQAMMRTLEPYVSGDKKNLGQKSPWVQEIVNMNKAVENHQFGAAIEWLKAAYPGVKDRNDPVMKDLGRNAGIVRSNIAGVDPRAVPKNDTEKKFRDNFLIGYLEDLAKPLYTSDPEAAVAPPGQTPAVPKQPGGKGK